MAKLDFLKNLWNKPDKERFVSDHSDMIYGPLVIDPYETPNFSEIYEKLKEQAMERLAEPKPFSIDMVQDRVGVERCSKLFYGIIFPLEESQACYDYDFGFVADAVEHYGINCKGVDLAVDFEPYSYYRPAEIDIETGMLNLGALALSTSMRDEYGVTFPLNKRSREFVVLHELRHAMQFSAGVLKFENATCMFDGIVIDDHRSRSHPLDYCMLPHEADANWFAYYSPLLSPGVLVETLSYHEIAAKEIEKYRLLKYGNAV